MTSYGGLVESCGEENGGEDSGYEEEKKQEEGKSQLDWVRILYCVANIARLDITVFGFYLNPYLLDAVGLDPSLVGILLLTKQLWDAFTDPIVGNLSDNTHTKWGRRRPWIVASFPFLGATWVIFWTILSDIEDQAWLFLYYLITLLAFTTCNTLTQLPFLCLLQEIAPTYGIRTKIIGLQEFCCQLACTVATFIMGVLTESFKTPAGDINYKRGYIASAVLLAPFIMFPRMISSLCITEDPSDRRGTTQPILEKEQEELKGSEEEGGGGWREFFVALFSALKIPDFSLVVISWSIINTVVFLFTANIVLYVKYYLASDAFEFVIVALLQLGFTLGFPIWMALIVPRLGKVRTSQVGSLCAGLLALGLFFIERDQEILFACLVPFLGFFAAGAFLAINAMQPDSCGVCMEKLNMRNEGVLYGIFLFGGKTGTGIALGMSSFALGQAGYEASLGEDVTQNEATLLTMRILLFIVPVIMAFLNIVVSFFIKDYKKEFSTVRYESVHELS